MFLLEIKTEKYFKKHLSLCLYIYKVYNADNILLFLVTLKDHKWHT